MSLPTDINTTNFNIYVLNNIELTNEYVSQMSINKALIKAYQNLTILAAYLNFEFTANISGGTFISGDIKPAVYTKPNINAQFFVGINEKTAPQVMNRIFENIYNTNAAIIAKTNTVILNPEQNIWIASPI